MTRKSNSLPPVFENGILIGWWGEAFHGNGEKVRVFIARREEDVERDIQLRNAPAQ